MKKSLVSLLLLAVMSLLSGSAYAWHETLPPEETKKFAEDSIPDINAFLEIKAAIKFLYYKEVDIDECMDRMYQAGLGGCLDPNSLRIPRKRVQENEEHQEGHFGGVGMELSSKDGDIVVIAPLQNMPAARAGVISGDIIVAVDGKEIRKMPLGDAVMLIRGKVGTKVTIKILRNGEEKVFELVRADIKVEMIFARQLMPDVGYIRVNQFLGKGIGIDTFNEFVSALEKFERGGTKKIVIDVRNNPGGFLHLVEFMVAPFAPNAEQILVTKSSRQGETIDRAGDFAHTESPVGRFRGLKVVVLANKHSASASEIFAGLMKEFGYPVVGQGTFGKGTVQRDLPLANGSLLHLTIAEYRIGNQKMKVDEVGISPTHEVKNYQVESGPEILREDLQLNKALELLRQD